MNARSSSKSSGVIDLTQDNQRAFDDSERKFKLDSERLPCEEQSTNEISVMIDPRYVNKINKPATQELMPHLLNLPREVRDLVSCLYSHRCLSLTDA